MLRINACIIIYVQFCVILNLLILKKYINFILDQIYEGLYKNVITPKNIQYKNAFCAANKLTTIYVAKVMFYLIIYLLHYVEKMGEVVGGVGGWGSVFYDNF